jgi:hypothetical protein
MGRTFVNPRTWHAPFFIIGRKRKPNNLLTFSKLAEKSPFLPLK